MAFPSLPTIHVIGDSHSNFFTYIPGCKIHHIGPRTMFGLRNGIPVTPVQRVPLDMRNYGAKPGEYVVYVFGEIDVRTHIGRIRDLQQKGLDEVLDDLVTTYLDIIQGVSEISLTQPIISSVVPPSDLDVNPEYPFYGTLQDRVIIQQALNKKLEVACAQKNILYLNYAHHYTTPVGSLNHAMSDGHVHIMPNCAQPAAIELYRLVMSR